MVWANVEVFVGRVSVSAGRENIRLVDRVAVNLSWTYAQLGTVIGVRCLMRLSRQFSRPDLLQPKTD